MTVLVTGGAGFIGSHLIDRLLEEGFNVVSVDNLSLGRRHHFSHHLKNPSFTFIEADLLDKVKMYDLFETYSFSTVFHFAANSDIQKSHETPSVDFYNTFLTTHTVLEYMRRFSIKNLVFASTSAVYGHLQGSILENSGPLFPLSHYGASKLASEAFIASYCENYDLKAWICRFPNVVGERATHGAVYDFIGRLQQSHEELVVLGNGAQSKPYLYVSDLVDAVLHLYKHTSQKINCYNIGTEDVCSVDTIAKIVLEEMGLKHTRISHTGGDRGWVGDVPHVRYNNHALLQTGWSPKHTSEEAVRKAVRTILQKDRAA